MILARLKEGHAQDDVFILQRKYIKIPGYHLKQETKQKNKNRAAWLQHSGSQDSWEGAKYDTISTHS